MLDVSDGQLVMAVARFHADALAEVYRRHGGAVFGLARRVTGDPTDAEDVTQDVFVALWHHPDRFDPSRGSLRTFLLTWCHGKAVDLVRSRTARQRREDREAGMIAASGYDVDREISDLVLADQVGRAMALLPEEERTAIELAYFEGRTYREVADLLAQPEGTVKSRIRNGLRRMRGVLSDTQVREQ